MGHRIFVASTREDRRRCALDAIRWGYLRSIGVDEMEGSFWVRYGNHAVFWFEWNESAESGELVLHVCVDPVKRGAIYPRKWTYAVEVFAEQLGAERVVYLGGFGGTPVDGMLERLGWRPHEHGLALELNPFGEDEIGQEAENQEGHSAD